LRQGKGAREGGRGEGRGTGQHKLKARREERKWTRRTITITRGGIYQEREGLHRKDRRYRTERPM
jgi:hypothetical protein